MSCTFENKNVLLTGGLGFIGSNVARKLLSLGCNVTIIDSLIPDYGGNKYNLDGVEDSVDINIADVRDAHAIKHLVQKKDYLINLAGQTSHLDSMQDPMTDLEINCKAQLSILETCRLVNPEIKIVFASTRQIYGKSQYLPVDENHPIVPVDVNGINKTASEWYHILYNNVYGIRSCVLRLTNTYGPRMRVKDARQTFLGIWIKSVLEGIPVKVYGDGTQLRDFNFVDDVVDALLVAAAEDVANGQVYNLGGSEIISLKDLAKLLVDVNGGGEYELVDFPEDLKKIDIGSYYSDFRKIKKDLKWKPEKSLREGLAKTLSFYRKNLKEYS
ncbi:NAD-dependent epimerase/dehydratase family protein [Verrucomicrobiota bacterium]